MFSLSPLVNQMLELGMLARSSHNDKFACMMYDEYRVGECCSVFGIDGSWRIVFSSFGALSLIHLSQGMDGMGWEWMGWE